jgi:hypothetical protein
VRERAFLARAPDEVHEFAKAAASFARGRLAPGARAREAERCLDEALARDLESLVPRELWSDLGSGGGAVAAFAGLFELAQGDAGPLPGYLRPGPFGGLVAWLSSKGRSDALSLLQAHPYYWVRLSPEAPRGEVICFSPQPPELLIWAGPDKVVFLEVRGAEQVLPEAFHASGSYSVDAGYAGMLGEEAFDACGYALAVAFQRMFFATIAAGVARQALLHARDYGRERIVFGKPVLAHQYNALELASAYAECAAANASLEHALSYLPSPEAKREDIELFSWLAGEAFVQAGRAARAATDLAVLLLGGHGYMEDEPVEKYWREVRAAVALAGGISSCLEDLGELACSVKDPLVL